MKLALVSLATGKRQYSSAMPLSMLPLTLIPVATIVGQHSVTMGYEIENITLISISVGVGHNTVVLPVVAKLTLETASVTVCNRSLTMHLTILKFTLVVECPGHMLNPISIPSSVLEVAFVTHREFFVFGRCELPTAMHFAVEKPTFIANMLSSKSNGQSASTMPLAVIPAANVGVAIGLCRYAMSRPLAVFPAANVAFATGLY